MTAGRLRTLLPRLREIAARPDGQAADRELLRRFGAEADEDAFAELVRRHGPMVLRACRRVLGNAHDAEDISQAAFLLLARKASTAGWHESIAGWLFQTAYRLSLKARVAAGRRARLEAQARPASQPDPAAELTVRELQTVLDEELSRLPEKYRAPVVLCCLEGRSRDEAAACLGWQVADVKNRLEQGRDRLRFRLARRGVALGTALTSAWLTEGAAHAGPAADATARAALLLATGQATLASLLPSPVAAVTNGVTRPMFLSRIVILAAGLALALGVAAGVTRPGGESAVGQEKPPPIGPAMVQPEGLPLAGHKEAVRAVAFAPDGKTVATSGVDKTIRIWEVVTGAQKYKMAHAWDKEGRQTDNLEWTAVVVGLAYSPDSKTLATHSTGKYGWLAWWDATKGVGDRSLRTEPHRQREEGGAVAFSPDGKLIAAGMGGGYTIVHPTEQGDKGGYDVHGPNGRASIAFSPDGKFLAVGGGGTVQLMDLPTGRKLRNPFGRRGKDAITAMAFLRGGTKLAAADGAKALRLLDTVTGDEERAFESAEAVQALAVSRDGKRVATGGAGGTVTLWDASGKEERRFHLGGAVNAVAFSPDGKRLATVGDDAVLWDLTRDEKPLPAHFRLSQKELTALWADLASEKGAKVYTASRLLRADPARSVPFLKERLKPKAGSEERKKLKRLIAELDSDEFAKREAATKDLAKLGAAAEPALREAMAARPSLEAKRRLGQLLKPLGEAKALTGEQQRDVRAVRVLELATAPEARKLLESLANEPPGWWVAQEANEALQRLARRDKKP